jgi:hypothetical protein
MFSEVRVLNEGLCRTHLDAYSNIGLSPKAPFFEENKLFLAVCHMSKYMQMEDVTIFCRCDVILMTLVRLQFGILRPVLSVTVDL